MADADHGYSSFKQTTRDRLLHEMLGSARKGKSSGWKVLIMDEVTVKVVSSSCKMADITDEGISLVEDLNKRRQPLPALDAVYFIQPIRESVRKLIEDMSGKTPLYKTAYVFFSSTLSRDLLNSIKSDTTLLKRISCLREVNLEYMTIDIQGFITDHDQAMQQLFGEQKDYDSGIDAISRRLGTVFASFKEFPLVRYRAARSAAANSTSATTACDLLPTKLAAALWDRLMKYKASLADFPQSETCELLILDRSIDPIAPVIHEWTYDAMCHDLLNIEGNKYTYQITTSSGKMEKKEVLLEEHDPYWAELRDLHIAEVNLRLNEKMKHFGSKNKAAEIKLEGRGGQDLSTKDMQRMVQALPQYRDQLEKLSLHIHIATVLNEKIEEERLRDVGELEQELVFGDASSKELISFLSNREDISSDSKLRLLMIYAATHPETLDEKKRLQWMKLARLSESDMSGVSNLEYFGISLSKKQSGHFSLKFKSKQAYRKERGQDNERWSHSRFYPLLQDLVNDMEKDELSKDEYPYVKHPSQITSASSTSTLASSSSRHVPMHPMPKPTVQSKRTSRGATSWATRSRASDDGYSSDSVLKSSVSDPSKFQGRRLFIFIIGGMTHSELRSAHKLSAEMKREVIIGSTGIDDPHQFVAKVKVLGDVDILDF